METKASVVLLYVWSFYKQMDCVEIPRNGDRQEMMIRQETGGKISGVSHT